MLILATVGGRGEDVVLDMDQQSRQEDDHMISTNYIQAGRCKFR